MFGDGSVLGAPSEHVNSCIRPHGPWRSTPWNHQPFSEDQHWLRESFTTRGRVWFNIYIYIYPYIYYLYLSIYMYISIYLYLYTVSIYLYNIYSNIIIWEGMWTSLCSTHSVAQRCGKPVWWRGKNPLTESPSRLDLLEYLEYLRMMLEYEPIPNLDRSRGVFWGFAHKLPPWRRSHGPWTPLIGRGNHLIGRA